MILISHRGNIGGPHPDKENSPEYILEALSFGFDVEIDVWLERDKFYLGHDHSEFLIDKSFLFNEKLWCHAKNLDALTALLKEPTIHCFWHQCDDVTLTSKQYIWTYPGKKIASERAIAVKPESQISWDISMAEGICSDFIADYATSISSHKTT